MTQKRQYTAEFKFKVVLESFQRDTTQARRQAQGYVPGESPDELKHLIGELTVQNGILKKPRGLLDH